MKRPLAILFSLLFPLGVFLLARTPAAGFRPAFIVTGGLLAVAGYLGLLATGLPWQGRGWLPVFLLLAVLPRLLALEVLFPFPDEPVRTLRGGGGLLLDLASLVALSLWIRSQGLARDRLLIFALNPLVIFGTAARAGSPDSLLVILLALGMLLHARDRPGSAMLLVTLAGLIRGWILFALPFFVERKTLKHLPLCGGLVLAGVLPLFLSGKTEGAVVGAGFFRSVFSSFSLPGLPGTAVQHATAWAVLLAVLCAVWLTRSRPQYAAPPLLLLAVFLGPAFPSGNLVPLVALASVWNSRALIALSVLCLPCLPELEIPPIAGFFGDEPMGHAGIMFLFLLILWVEMSGRWPSVSRCAEKTVGIVVPVLNDAGPLGGLLASLEKTGVPPGQVVVVDGGSTDGSAGVARRWGALVLDSPVRGRGCQIARGAGVLDSELVLILHADNRVPSNLLEMLGRVSAAYPQACGGAFRLVYGTQGLRMRVLSIFSNAKAFLFGLSFGDQGQWFRNGKVSVPEIPLMEDVELAVRMNDTGGSVWTPAALGVSTRRYSEKGTLSVLRSVVVFTLGYLFRRRWEGAPPDTTDLYRRYYGDRKEASPPEENRSGDAT